VLYSNARGRTNALPSKVSTRAWTRLFESSTHLFREEPPEQELEESAPLFRYKTLSKFSITIGFTDRQALRHSFKSFRFELSTESDNQVLRLKLRLSCLVFRSAYGVLINKVVECPSTAHCESGRCSRRARSEGSIRRKPERGFFR